MVRPIVAAPNQTEYKVQSVKRDKDVSDKSRSVALIFCLFFGMLGIHNFYAGKTGKGVLYIFTFGLFYIGWFVDAIMILAGAFTDSDGKRITNW